MFLRAGLGGLSLDIFGGIEGLWSTGCLESGLVPRIVESFCSDEI